MVRLAKHVTGFLGMLIVVVFLFQGAATASADEGENAQSALQSLAVIKQTDDYRSSERAELFGTWLHSKTLGGNATTRDDILSRDLKNVTYTNDHHVATGVLNDPYTGETIAFQRGQGTSNAVQIDHVVAVGEAYESGADYWTKEQRVAYANDSYVLLAVKGSANASKSDKDAAHWLPGHGYDCAYVSRQIGIKQHYHLAVDSSERNAMKSSLSQCPLGQTVPLYDGNNATPNTPELPSEPSKPNTPSTPSEPTSGKLARLSGITRYDTMSWIVDTAFPDSTSTVIVASGENYPDALAASGFAGVLDAPILMTDPLYLSNQTKDQISRLKPGKIIIVGGQNAVSRNVEQSLVQYATVQRIGGVTRGDTALKLYDSDVQGEENWGRTAIVVTGGNGSSGFADALSVSSYAYASKSPIFLSDINFGLSSEQLEALSSGEFDRILVVGGQHAVPDSVMKQIRDSSGSAVSRISGATRYETSITFAQRVSEQGDLHMNNVVFATGANFPDALAAGPFAGRNKAILLLADPNGSTAGFVKQYVKQHGDVDNAYIVGGENAVSRNTANGLADALDMLRP